MDLYERERCLVREGSIYLEVRRRRSDEAISAGRASLVLEPTGRSQQCYGFGMWSWAAMSSSTWWANINVG